MLKAFKPTGKQCNWPGCCNPAVKVTFDVPSKSKHCIKHQLHKLSGRVGPNWKRDSYREHMKSVCSISGFTWKQAYQEVENMCHYFNLTPARYTKVRRACQMFQVDHIDGNHANNHPNNLQTVTPTAHKFKTDMFGDADGWKNRR